ncbi:hypothetical protein [Flavilitoribacter nigricans]|uniref:Uncharacterized protein n=1 Tax=Flavilitoribacter nigricans (strain ATCC 23147 / DSM 23189 / NBRC 102662 / NCIMB 1420 / SS-2) TaxID=1122177 RepID=A0A2D0N6Y5_FLAN2|nr:hypothetical protein [Flavilitoribacter nigricans]PHN04150.1 hypothetical protein CRP01_23425 [Flavilitoribacter nigricans DSM 23189 = NBRC 102662]
MNYQIITDPEQLHKFIEWLPDLEEDEKYYCCLFSRKKYTPDGQQRHDKTQLKRFLTDKTRLYNKIRQLEVPLGAYELKKTTASQESLAMYINPNPRNLRLAAFEGIIELTRLLKNNDKRFNPQAEILNCIQQSHSRKVYLDFDVDTKDFDFDQLAKVINPSCLDILETRGGFHVLVRIAEIDPTFKKSFYNDIMALGVDQSGDQLLPVPGCVQGGFTPRFVRKF